MLALGRAYLPMDPALPETANYVDTRDARSSCSWSRRRLWTSRSHSFCTSSIAPLAVASRLEPSFLSDPVWIFTSGSTGRPKAPYSAPRPFQPGVLQSLPCCPIVILRLAHKSVMDTHCVPGPRNGKQQDGRHGRCITGKDASENATPLKTCPSGVLRLDVSFLQASLSQKMGSAGHSRYPDITNGPEAVYTHYEPRVDDVVTSVGMPNARLFANAVILPLDLDSERARCRLSSRISSATRTGQRESRILWMSASAVHIRRLGEKVR